MEGLMGMTPVFATPTTSLPFRERVTFSSLFDFPAFSD